MLHIRKANRQGKVIIHSRFWLNSYMVEKKGFTRVPRDEYYLRIAYDVAARSTCLRRQIGAVIVTGDVIVSTGYNGNPRGMPHCDAIGCIRDELEIPSGERMEICTGVHAEMNALVFSGPAARGGTLYCTIVPCNTCAKMIVNAGIQRVVYSEGYPDILGLQTLKHSGIKVDRLTLGGERAETTAILKDEKREEAREHLDARVLRDIEEMKKGLREEFAKKTAPATGSFNERAARSLKRKIERIPKKGK